MVKNENPALRCQPQSGERNVEIGNELSFSNYDFSTNSPNGQLKIFDILPEGAENAVKAADLARMAGAPSIRGLQRKIQAERNAGLLILSTSRGGYFRPAAGDAGRREIESFYRTCRSRAVSTLKILKTARAALGTVQGQECLPELEEVD